MRCVGIIGMRSKHYQEQKAGRSAKLGSKLGFTIVEVVVASALMVLVFAAVFGTLSAGRRSVSLVENRLAALHIARETVENLRSLGFFDTALSAGVHNLPGGRGQYSITNIDSGQTKNVAVTIVWVEPTGAEKSLSLTTSFSKSLHR